MYKLLHNIPYIFNNYIIYHFPKLYAVKKKKTTKWRYNSISAVYMKCFFFLFVIYFKYVGPNKQVSCASTVLGWTLYFFHIEIVYALIPPPPHSFLKEICRGNRLYVNENVFISGTALWYIRLEMAKICTITICFFFSPHPDKIIANLILRHGGRDTFTQ